MASANTSGIVLTPRFGPRPVVTAGALIAAGGMLYLTRLGLGSAYAPDVLPGLLVAGLGMGMIFSPTQNAATAGTRPGDTGVASAMIIMAQQIGGAIGTALLTSVATSATAGYLDDTTPGPQTAALATVHGYHAVFWCSAGFFLLCAVISAVTFRGARLVVEPDPVPAGTR
jgi:MFS family permease